MAEPALQCAVMPDYTHGTAILIGSPLGPGYYLGSDPARTLRSGMRGDEVRSLQQALTSAGFTTKGVDGVFGNNTEKAVREFQRARGLSVTGVADAETLAALNSSSSTLVKPSSDAKLDESSSDRPDASPFTRRYGPLPLYGWGCVIVALGGCAYLLRPSISRSVVAK